MSRTSLSIVLLLAVTSHVRAGTIRVNNAAGFNKAIAAAKPGDQILLEPGDYGENFYFRKVHGTAKEPIVIAAAEPNRPPRLVGKTAPLHFGGTSHLELRDLIISGASGNGLNIDDGGKADNASHHITLRSLQIRDIGPKGNRDGIKLSGVDDFSVIDCTVERWGSGGSAIDMVGCHRGTISGCTFRQGGSNGVQTKGGSSEITIRKCRFEEAGERAVNIGGSTGNDLFRPPLKDMPEKGKYEAKSIRVEGCTFIRGGASVVFVGVDGAIVRYNTIYQPGRYAIRILQEKTDPEFIPCRNGVFENNVVVFESNSWVTGGVNIGDKTSPETFKFAGNLWYCQDRPARSEPKLPVAEKNGLVGKDPLFVDPKKGDFGVRQNSPCPDRGAHALPEK